MNTMNEMRLGETQLLKAVEKRIGQLLDRDEIFEIPSLKDASMQLLTLASGSEAYSTQYNFRLAIEWEILINIYLASWKPYQEHLPARVNWLREFLSLIADARNGGDILLQFRRYSKRKLAVEFAELWDCPYPVDSQVYYLTGSDYYSEIMKDFTGIALLMRQIYRSEGSANA